MPHPHDNLLHAFLRALVGPPPSGWLDLRAIGADGHVARRFAAAPDTNAAAAFVASHCRNRDVYLGVALRTERAGGRAAIGSVTALWADCDTDQAADRLAAFRPTPSIVIRSGRPAGRHAYWLLTEPAPAAHAEAVNRTLAAALGADPRCAHAAALLRPPQTLNHKYDPPAAVTADRLTATRHRLADVLAAVPATAPETAPAVAAPAGSRQHRGGSPDPLRQLAPAFYVERLLGVPVPPSRKIRCPFHDDRRPSLHVYEDSARGWYCFGCRRGGSVYDLAAATWRTTTRGRDFVALRYRLEAALV